MPPRIPISSLLNSPTPTSCLPPANSSLDQQAALSSLAGLRDQALLSDAPPLIIESISHVANYFQVGSTSVASEQAPGPTAPPSHHSVDPDPLIWPQQSPTIHRNVYMSSKTTLSILYTYEDMNAWVEYPETSPDQLVGYLFRCDPCNWENPVWNFAYSLGKPSGQTK